jgi:hypothetical protein
MTIIVFIAGVCCGAAAMLGLIVFAVRELS